MGGTAVTDLYRLPWQAGRWSSFGSLQKCGLSENMRKRFAPPREIYCIAPIDAAEESHAFILHGARPLSVSARKLRKSVVSRSCAISRGHFRCISRVIEHAAVFLDKANEARASTAVAFIR